MQFNPVTIIIIVVALIVLAVLLHFVPMGLWISSLASGVHISISSLTAFVCSGCGCGVGLSSTVHAVYSSRTRMVVMR